MMSTVIAVTYEAAKQQLVELIASRALPPLQAAILNALALDDYGFQLSAAPSILAPEVNCSTEVCLENLTELISANLVIRVADQIHPRVVANYAILGVSEELRQALRQGRPSPFEQLDAPHSAEAMETLHQMFLQETRPLYIGLEMTSHRVFQRLEERASSGRLTVFLMPARRLISPERQRHYDDILDGWIRFVKGLAPGVRQNVRLRVTRIPYRYLYTSSLTPTFIRFDCYWYDQGSTRRGTMVSASKGSSLYDLVYREYSEAVLGAAPLRQLWFWDWARHLASRFTPVLVTAALVAVAYGLVTILGKTLEPVNYLAAFLVGLAGESFWDLKRARRHAVRGLYEN